MRFWPTFFGSFHSVRTYVDARLVHRGYGIGYSVMVLALCGAASLAYLLSTTVFVTPQWRDLESIGVIFAGMLVIRAAMLAPLTIACCLLGHLFKLRLTYAQGARLTAIAYTPVALFDTIAYSLTSYGIAPPILFGCGIAMLLAALNAAK